MAQALVVQAVAVVVSTLDRRDSIVLPNTPQNLQEQNDVQVAWEVAVARLQVQWWMSGTGCSSRYQWWMLWAWRARAIARLNNMLVANFVGRLLPAGAVAVPMEPSIGVEGPKRVTELAQPHGAHRKGLGEHIGSSSFIAMYVSEMPKQFALRGQAGSPGCAAREHAM